MLYLKSMYEALKTYNDLYFVPFMMYCTRLHVRIKYIRTLTFSISSKNKIFTRPLVMFLLFESTTLHSHVTYGKEIFLISSIFYVLFSLQRSESVFCLPDSFYFVERFLYKERFPSTQIEY